MTSTVNLWKWENSMSTTDLALEKAQKVLSMLFNSRNEDFGKDTVTFECADGIIKAHKTVLLTSGSEYFAGMFSSDNEENRTNTVKFRDTAVEVMDIVVKHLHSQDFPDPADLSEEIVCDLVLEANKLQLRALYDRYWGFYSKSAKKPTNFIHLWQLSNMLNETHYMEELMSFLASNLTEITKSEAFLNIDASQLSILITRHLIRGLDNRQRIAVFRFILNWGSEEKSAKDIISLLSICGLTELPDTVLLNVTNKLLNNEVKELLNNEVIRRWRKSNETKYYIHTVCIADDGKCERSRFSLNKKSWLKGKRCKSKLNEVIMESLNLWVRYCSCVNSPSLIQLGYGQTVSTEDTEKMVFETANIGTSYFKLSDDKGYLAIGIYVHIGLTNIYKYRIISSESYGNCKRLLLANERKLYFDVDENSFKIYDVRRNVCELISKPVGKWKCFDCPSRNLEMIENMSVYIYFFDENNRLLLFDVENETWKEDAVPIDLDVNLNDAKFVNYEEAFVMIPIQKLCANIMIYSLREKCKITELDVSSNEFFDVSLED